MHRRAGVAIVVVALAASLGLAPSAVAVEASGQHITVIHAVPEGDSAAVSQFYEIDSANAVGTPIGSPVVERHLIALDVDATGQGFALGTGSPSEPKLQLLFRVDVVTGTVTDPIPLDFPLDVGQCFDVDLLADGALLATCEGLDAANAPTTWVSLVDTATGSFTHILTTPVGAGGPHYRGIATNPATHETWVFSELDGQAYSFKLDLDGFVWPLTPLDVLPLAADFAEIGPQGPPQLLAILAWVRREFAAVDPGTGVIRSVAAFPFDATEKDDVTAITVWGAPALAATGGGADGILPLGVASLLLVLAGGAVFAVGRRRMAAERMP